MGLRLSTGLRNEIMKVTGKSFCDAMATGALYLYQGSQPASPDDAENSTLLCKITLASGAKTPGVGTNGISMGQVADGIAHKASGEVWSGVASASGTVGWFRFYDIDETTGASTTAKRFDGNVATSGADLNMSNTTITSGGTVTIDSVSIALPAS